MKVVYHDFYPADFVCFFLQFRQLQNVSTTEKIKRNRCHSVYYINDARVLQLLG